MRIYCINIIFSNDYLIWINSQYIFYYYHKNCVNCVICRNFFKRSFLSYIFNTIFIIFILYILTGISKLYYIITTHCCVIISFFD